MIFTIKKFVLSGLIILSVCFTAYAISRSIDLGGWSLSNNSPNPTHICDSATHTHETFVTHHEDHDKYVGICTNNETKERIATEVAYVYHDDVNSSNLESPSHNHNNSDSATSSRDHDYWDDHLRDQSIDTHNERVNNNQTTQNQSTKLSNSQIVKFNKIASEYSRQANGSKVYYTAISPKTINFEINKSNDIIAALKLPAVQERLQYFKEWSQKYSTKDNVGKKNFVFVQKEIIFIDKLLSGEIEQLLKQVLYADPTVAQSALNELKTLWPYDREYKFLVPLYSSDREDRFILYTLGEDIIKIAEQDLFTRQDYIAHYANEQEQKILQNYKEKCISLQQKGDIAALYNESKNLCFFIITNNKKNDFVVNAYLAIAETTLHNPITTVLRNIRHISLLEKAYVELMNLEIQILDQAQKINILHTDKIKQWTVDHYGFDVLDAAQKCYTSRADYIATAEKQSLFSDNIRTIVDNIEHKDLSSAHAELLHFDTQVNKILVDRNIIDPIAQKEYIKKLFGKDVLEIAHKTYEAREDYKKLAESFIPLDVEKSIVTILEKNNTYESVANEMNDLAKSVFFNADHCNLSNLPKIQWHVYGSIDAMRIAQDQPTFIFNLSMVNRTLGDIQILTHSILNGTHPAVQRTSELFIRGLGKFMNGLNPVTQISNMGKLALDLGSLVKKGGEALWNDPIAAIDSTVTSLFTLRELLRNTAEFVSDLTVGKLFLSAEEYKKRTDAFCEMVAPLKDIPAEHYVDFVAQVAADVTFCKGLGATYELLKEIDVLSKLGKSAAVVSRTFKKGFNTHFASHPSLVTAEGLVLQMSNDLKNVGGTAKEIINSSRTLIESAYAPIATNLEKIIKTIRESYILNPKHDFPSFGNKHIKIALEHILGMELKWSDLGSLINISGFHHDFMGAIEKSKVFKFLNKVIKENGCYSVDIVVDGKTIPKTFFPQHWTQKEVADKIYEAYYNFRKSGAIAPEKGGKYVIDGLTNEGITVRMFVTKGGEIVTAYPKLQP